MKNRNSCSAEVHERADKSFGLYGENKGKMGKTILRWGVIGIIVLVFTVVSTDTIATEPDALEAYYNPGNGYPSSPVVGDIDGDGHPEIVFSACTNPQSYSHSGYLTVFRKYADSTIELVWTRSDLGGAPYAPALGDLNNDGVPEIVVYVYGTSGKVMAIEPDGTTLWSTPVSAGYTYDYWSNHDPAINDVNLDGYADVAIYVSTGVGSGVGKIIVLSGNDGSVLPGWPVTTASIFAYSQISILDILGPEGNPDELDGIPEIIASSYAAADLRVYDNIGNLLWIADGSGNFAVVDLENDGLPEIVSSADTSKKLNVYDNQGNVKYSSDIDNFASGPTVADFDQDGYPEIAISVWPRLAGGNIRLYDFYDFAQGNIPSPILWETGNIGVGEYDNPDLTATDLNGDGSPEVTVISDDYAAIVIDGMNGNVIWNSNIWINENEHSPVIADVDNDGHSEIVVPSGDGYMGASATYDRKILILGNDDTWVDARNVWSQMGYYATNINDDLRVPNDYHPWTTWNTWRAQLPEMATISVDVDIKPGSCPNPLNKKSKGVLPIAILGNEEFDVTAIDPETIRLTREGIENGALPLRFAYEDVATPFEGELCECHDLNGDGFLDLTLKFNTPELVDELNLCEFSDGETIPLTITGKLYEEEGGTPINGQDCVWIKDKDRK